MPRYSKSARNTDYEMMQGCQTICCNWSCLILQIDLLCCNTLITGMGKVSRQDLWDRGKSLQYFGANGNSFSTKQKSDHRMEQ